MKRRYFVYILASKRHGTLYIGVTNDLVRRLEEHRSGAIKGFSSKYRTYRLVHYEVYGEVKDAIAREKRLKKWNRQWKLDLIEEQNPKWEDLADQVA
jgi:putative endonuclease